MSVAVMKHNNATIPPHVQAVDAELADLRATSAYALAAPLDRVKAERPLLKKRQDIVDRLVDIQRGHLARVKQVWLERTPPTVQRKAAIANPQRAVSVGELAALAGPAEAVKLAALLVAEDDAAGAYGLRQAVARFEGTNHASAVKVAFKAGTQESDVALRNLLLAKRELVRTVQAVTTEPVHTLTEIHESFRVEQEDGSTATLSQKEVETIIGDSV